MSAGFCTAYDDIVRQDLRHIYSGYPQGGIKYRSPIYHQGISFYDRIREQRKRPRVNYFPRKHLEYLESYDICIPRAPAFRSLSKSEIDNLVYRLHAKQDTERNQRHHLQAHERMELQQQRSKLHSAPVTSGRGKRSHVSQEKREPDITSKEHLSAIVERLYQGQTHISTLRKRGTVVSQRCKSAPAATEKSK